MFPRAGQNVMRVMTFLIRLLPVGFLYNNAISRKALYRVFYLSTGVFVLSFFRRPFVLRQFQEKEQSQKAVQEQALTATLSQLDIRLGDFQEDYFVIIAGNCRPDNRQEIEEKQQVVYELNAQVNKRVELSPSYFRDVKFLFIGAEDIYSLLQSGSTLIEFYPKERERSEESGIYVFARQEGTQKLISAIGYRPNLSSILRIISKHRARKFASEIQFE